MAVGDFLESVNALGGSGDTAMTITSLTVAAGNSLVATAQFDIDAVTAPSIDDTTNTLAFTQVGSIQEQPGSPIGVEQWLLSDVPNSETPTYVLDLTGNGTGYFPAFGIMELEGDLVNEATATSEDQNSSFTSDAVTVTDGLIVVVSDRTVGLSSWDTGAVFTRDMNLDTSKNNSGYDETPAASVSISYTGSSHNSTYAVILTSYKEDAAAPAVQRFLTILGAGT